MMEDEIIEALAAAKPEVLAACVLLLALEVKEMESTRIRVIPDDSPPEVSMAEMASRWATWGVGPNVWP